MLAQTADDPGDALARLGRAALEWKLDGARVQVHRVGDEVRVFTRQLNDVTDAVPELVEVVRALPARALVLDGEAIALRADGAPEPFQITMRRFGRRLDVERLRAELPLSAFFFDCLHVDGDDLLDRTGDERFAALARARARALRVPRLVTGDAAAARAFLDAALARGHEGVMAKSLDAPYEAGRRGAGWLKVKRAHTLDLVVLAVEWGSGRRRGWLSNLHLGARDPATGGFVMLGKTFKGMTDEMLAWQTRRFRSSSSGATSTRSTCGPSWSSRSPSTACRRARTTPAASRCASRASSATAPTSAPRRPTRSTPCARWVPRQAAEALDPRRSAEGNSRDAALDRRPEALPHRGLRQPALGALHAAAG